MSDKINDYNKMIHERAIEEEKNRSSGIEQGIAKAWASSASMFNKIGSWTSKKIGFDPSGFDRRAKEFDEVEKIIEDTQKRRQELGLVGNTEKILYEVGTFLSPENVIGTTAVSKAAATKIATQNKKATGLFNNIRNFFKKNKQKTNTKTKTKNKTDKKSSKKIKNKHNKWTKRLERAFDVLSLFLSDTGESHKNEKSAKHIEAPTILYRPKSKKMVWIPFIERKFTYKMGKFFKNNIVNKIANKQIEYVKERTHKIDELDRRISSFFYNVLANQADEHLYNIRFNNKNTKKQFKIKNNIENIDDSGLDIFDKNRKNKLQKTKLSKGNSRFSKLTRKIRGLGYRFKNSIKDTLSSKRRKELKLRNNNKNKNIIKNKNINIIKNKNNIQKPKTFFESAKTNIKKVFKSFGSQPKIQTPKNEVFDSIKSKNQGLRQNVKIIPDKPEILNSDNIKNQVEPDIKKTFNKVDDFVPPKEEIIKSDPRSESKLKIDNDLQEIIDESNKIHAELEAKAIEHESKMNKLKAEEEKLAKAKANKKWYSFDNAKLTAQQAYLKSKRTALEAANWLSVKTERAKEFAKQTYKTTKKLGLKLNEAKKVVPNTLKTFFKASGSGLKAASNIIRKIPIVGSIIGPIIAVVDIAQSNSNIETKNAIGRGIGSGIGGALGAFAGVGALSWLTTPLGAFAGEWLGEQISYFGLSPKDFIPYDKMDAPLQEKQQAVIDLWNSLCNDIPGWAAGYYEGDIKKAAETGEGLEDFGPLDVLFKIIGENVNAAVEKITGIDINNSGQINTFKGLSEVGAVDISGIKQISLNASQQEVLKLLDEVGHKVGVDPVILKAIAASESGLNPKAQNKNATADGLFQMLNGAWNDTAKKYGKQYGIPTVTQRGGIKLDPMANALMGAHLIKDNLKIASQFIDKLSPVDAYIPHFLGPGGARIFYKRMKANPNELGWLGLADNENSGVVKYNKIYWYADDKRTPLTKAGTYQKMANTLNLKIAKYGLSSSGTIEQYEQDRVGNAAKDKVKEGKIYKENPDLNIDSDNLLQDQNIGSNPELIKGAAIRVHRKFFGPTTSTGAKYGFGQWKKAFVGGDIEIVDGAGNVKFRAVTVEQAKEGTISGKSLRIPAGTYNLMWHNSPSGKKHKSDTPKLYNAQVSAGRGILFHFGNTVAWSEGCIVFAYPDDTKHGRNSPDRSVQDKFRNVLKSLLGYQPKAGEKIPIVAQIFNEFNNVDIPKPKPNTEVAKNAAGNSNTGSAGSAGGQEEFQRPTHEIHTIDNIYVKRDKSA